MKLSIDTYCALDDALKASEKQHERASNLLSRMRKRAWMMSQSKSSHSRIMAECFMDMLKNEYEQTVKEIAR